jgi:multisubunit Na+/H+ antiporter MnhE subunit
MKNKLFLFLFGATLVGVFAGSTAAKDLSKTVTLDSLRIELHILPAEPFFTKDQVASDHVTEGMLVVSGAEPVGTDAASHPNHHLVVHAFNTKTGKAITNADVAIGYHLLDKNGKPSTDSGTVPIVIMQAIGKGAQSTHYGNNVTLVPGTYSIHISVNGAQTSFTVAVTENEKDSMPGMKM